MGLVTSALLARLLSPAEMGMYFLTFSIVTVAALAARLGLDKTVVKLIAGSLGLERPAQARQALRPVFLLATFSAAIVGGVYWLLVGEWLAEDVFRSPLMAGVTGLTSVWIAILTFRILLAECFRGFHDIRLATLFGGMTTAVLSAIAFGILWVVRGDASLHTGIAFSVAAAGTSVILAVWLLFKKVRLVPGKGGVAIPLKSILHDSWPFLISNLTAVAITQADLWIIGAFREEQDVAIYGAAARLVLLVNVSIMIANQVLPPIISELHVQGKKEQLERVLQGTATLTAIPAMIVLLALVGFGGPILALVFSGFYRAGASILLLLALARVVAVLVGSCEYVLMMTGHQRTMMAISMLTGTITVVGALAVVDAMGPLGVALVAAGAIIIQQLLMLFFAHKLAGVWTYASPSLLLRSVKRIAERYIG